MCPATRAYQNVGDGDDTETAQMGCGEELKTDEDMAFYLEAAMEEAGDDAAFITKVLGDIARARGMTQLARDTGIGRESLYKALSGEGNPSFATILKVVHALGVRLHAAPLSVSGKQGRASRKKTTGEFVPVR